MLHQGVHDADYDVQSTQIALLTASSPLSGKHLIASGLNNYFNFYLMRNASGFIVKISGVGGQMLNWLSIYHNFTYSPLQVGDVGFDNVQTGLVGYLLRGECDIVGSMIPTPYRVALVDFTHTVLYLPSYFMIPAAKSSTNLLAAALPFQTPVWIGIAMAMLLVLISMFLLNYWYSSRSKNEVTPIDSSRASVYVFGILLDQAGQNLNRKLPMLFIGAAWCLSTLVLINAYTSLLTSYMTAPNPQPLIKTAQDLRDRSDVWIVTDKNRNSEALLLTAELGFLKDLGDKLRAYPFSSCRTPIDCAELVKSRSNAYVSTRDAFLLQALLDDFKATGQCNMELGKVELFMIQSAWTLAKNSPYTSYINKGILRMRDTGLVAGWTRQFKPRIPQCTERNKKGNSDSIVQLSLGHLFGAFVALLTGYLASFVAFVVERIVFAMKN